MLADRVRINSGDSNKNQYFLASAYEVNNTSTYMLKSYNGIDWEILSRPTLSNGGMDTMVYGKGVWVSSGYFQNKYSLDEGLTWSTWSGSVPTSGEKNTIYNEAQGVFISSDYNAVYRSTNGTLFTKIAAYTTGENMTALASNTAGTIMLGMGTAGKASKSTNAGTSWVMSSVFSSGLDASTEGLAFGNGVFVAGGFYGGNINNRIFGYSTDGATFTYTNTVANTSIKGVYFGNGIFVVTGWNSEIWTNNGASTTLTLKSTLAIDNVVYGNGIWVARSGFNIVTSTDLINWTTRYTSGTIRVSCIGFGGKLM